jgi:eukaryotic-like serine/threonine-protein kinase
VSQGKPNRPQTPGPRPGATVELSVVGDGVLIDVSGVVDEHFEGFGDLGPAKTAAINVAAMTRMTSFGVRQWLKAITVLPKSIADLYLIGCPTFFVDQLNMVLNFGGAAKILTIVAPYTCPTCGIESGETIDLIADRPSLARGAAPDKSCERCGSKLEFDEAPESYFAFMGKYAATGITRGASELLAASGLYASSEIATEKPPRIIKLVHGSVTYFRIIGTIGGLFRARPFLVGAEGEIVIDLAEVDRFDAAGKKEWRRLIKSLTGQVPAVTLVDVNASFLENLGDSLTLARNLAAASLLVPYRCVECGRAVQESVSLETAAWPMSFAEHVCSTCGGITQSDLARDLLAPLQKASMRPPPASAKVVALREEILSRAMVDATVALAGEAATPTVSAEDTILGKYRVVRKLSAGGMAEVFLAKQVGIGGFEKPVAIKRIQRKLLESRHQAIDMFLNEAKIAGRLTHPNIVQVLDVGEDGGALYLAMEYVHGKDLRKVIKALQKNRTTMPLGEALFIVREIAQALHHAYWSTDMTGKRMSVVHRDVSPHNVILGYDGAVKLLDFGVAMSAVTEHAESLIVGKWLYMSPEATTNQHIDHRSDLFSLGVILYLLCSGHLPFTGYEPKEIVKKIRAGQYRPLQEIAQVPDQLAILVKRLLAPNLDDRPQRGHEVALQISEIARRYGIESSGNDIAYVLKQLFPSEAQARLDHDVPSVRELAKLGTDEISPPKDKAAASITPNSNSSARSPLPVDVSETFKQSTGNFSMQSSVSTGLRQSSQSIPSARLGGPTPLPLRDRHRSLPPAPAGRTGRILISILVAMLAIAAVLAATTYLVAYS